MFDSRNTKGVVSIETEGVVYNKEGVVYNKEMGNVIILSSYVVVDNHIYQNVHVS